MGDAMRRFYKVFMVLICCALFIITGIDIGWAFWKDPIICYDGRKKEIRLLNVEQLDLFENFKDIIPGDTVTQSLYMKGKNIQNPANMYLHIEVNDEIEIPQGIKLKVYAENQLISEKFLDHCKEDKKEIFLHQYEKSDILKLDMVLEVPTNIGNEISNLCKEVYWTFVVQEDSLVVLPETGDAGIPIGTVVINICSLIVIVGILISKSKDSFIKK